MIAPLAAALLLAAAAPGDDDEPRWEEPGPVFQLTGWGGLTLPTAAGGGGKGWLGAEAGWLLSRSTLSVLFESHRYGAAASDRPWTPVILARWEQRLESGPGAEAGLVLGLGAGRPSRDWVFWYQLSLVGRLVHGPWFVSAEAGLERNDAARLCAGAGVRF